MFARAVVLLAACMAARQAAGTNLENGEALLVGIYVNDANGEDMDVYRVGERYWMPLYPVADLVGITYQDSAEAVSLHSPLGSAAVSRAELADVQGITYVSDASLQRALAIRSEFDQSEYAIRLQVPWTAKELARHASTEIRSPLVPDVRAPAGSLSLLRFRSDYRRNLDTGTDFPFATLDVGGRAGPGTWLIGGQRDARDTRLNRYFWNHELDRAVYRVGTNFADLSPLLDNVPFTGAQAAWTNGSINRYTDFASDLNFDSFLAEDENTQRDISRTDGPPGGIAELRINDQPIERTRIDLSGAYEFRALPLSPGNFQKVEIYIYQSSTLANPVEVIDLSRQIVGQTLSSGEVLLRAGGGDIGNPFDSDDPFADSGDGTGFVQARYGVSDWLTVQTMIQRGLDESDIGVVGIRSLFGHNWALAVDVSDRDGANGVDGELLGGGEGWDFSLRSLAFEPRYRPGDSKDQSRYDNVLRFDYNLTDNFRAGLVGRHYRNQLGEEIDFLWPSAYWNVTTGLLLSAVPNLTEQYRLAADFYPNPTHRFTAQYDNRIYSLLHYYNFGAWGSVDSGYEYSEPLSSNRVFSQVNWYVNGNSNNYLQGGLSYNGDNMGYFVSWNRVVRPGIEFDVALQQDYRNFQDLDEDLTLFAALRLDFAAVDGRLAATDNRQVNFTRGGIAGRIRDTDGNVIDVENVRFRVNGEQLSQSQAGGSYFLRDIKPGIYEVAIDEANLPIEYVPVKPRQLVEVGRAAVTRADFLVRMEFGASGQVTDPDGAAMGGVLVVALDAAGGEVGRGNTGQFGYFRIDSLAPGTYTLEVRVEAPDGDRVAGERQVVITDDFLFDQNLVLQKSG